MARTGVRAPQKPPSLREVARRSRDGGSFHEAGFYGENEGNGGTPSVPASGGDSSLKEGALRHEPRKSARPQSLPL